MGMHGGQCREAIQRCEEREDVLERVNIFRNCSRIKATVALVIIVDTWHRVGTWKTECDYMHFFLNTELFL